jgi:hypothetical protein
VATGPHGGHQQGPPGGIGSLPDVRQAIRLDSLGLSGDRYLESTDEVERLTLLARAQGLEERRETDDWNRSITLVEAVLASLGFKNH